MKSTNIIIAGAISMCLYNTVIHACETAYTTISCYAGLPTFTATHCKNNSTTTKCIKVNTAGNYLKLVSCANGCATGYIPDTTYATEVSTLCNQNYSNFLSCDCKCSNCTTTEWKSDNAMIESRTVATCNCSSGSAVCTKTPEYRCQAGYYGTPTGRDTSNFSQCSYCPTKTGDSRATSAAGSTTITKCYIPDGTYTDDTGTYTLTQKCYYTE